MSNLLKDIHDKAETLEGKNLALVLASVFLFFLFIGIGINYLTGQRLKNNENPAVNNPEQINQNNESYLEGVITYVDPRTYPGEDISFYLADSDGNELILLKANDQKLEVSEGLNVKLQGKRIKTRDGKKDVLFVDRIVVKRGS